MRHAKGKEVEGANRLLPSFPQGGEPKASATLTDYKT